MRGLIFEVCVDSVEGAVAAQQGGAQRVELCADLVEGGVTPSIGMLRLVRQSVCLVVNVIIRPRGGDFVYTPLEFAVMQEDIRAAKAAGVDGVVLGLLLPDGQVDRERTKLLVDLARPLSVTFHRAIDVCRDPFEALETLIDLGIERVLTSGGRPSALEGADCIARLEKQANERIAILAGGGITAENISALAAATGVHEFHFSAREAQGSPMRFQVPTVLMGKPYQPEEYIRRVTSVEKVSRVVAAARSGV